MKLQDFIKQNRQELDECIKKVCNNCRLNNQERKLWILNDEDLYHWARSEGVKI